MKQQQTLTINSDDDMREFGQTIGRRLRGGETIELIGDVGAGKTTFTKGLALGMNIVEPIQSPTYTINRMYETPHGLRLAHYDFYRLHEAGIMSDELHETLREPTTVTVVEWADVVSGVLPEDRLAIRIVADSETSRSCTVTAFGESAQAVLEGV